MESKKHFQSNRNSSIELLRILLICGVIVLHYVSGPFKLMSKSNPLSMNFFLIVFLNSVSICAVDTFIIISGYFSCGKTNISTKKLIKLVLEVIVFQLIFLFLFNIKNRKPISLAAILYELIPKNYYLTLYVTLMMFSPYINRCIRTLSKKAFEIFINIYVVIFFFEPTIADIIEGLIGKTVYGISTIGILGSQWGYTIVTFLGLYFVGAYIRIYGIKWDLRKNYIIYFASIMLLFFWKLIEVYTGFSLSAEHYMNPIVLINAVTLFVIFKNFDINNKWINSLSKGCFIAFLVHDKVMLFFDITRFASSNSILFLFIWTSCIIVIFLVSDVVGIIYCFFENKIFILLSRVVNWPVISVDEISD